MAPTPERVVLASASPMRAHLLETAGVAFSIEPAAIDESTIKREMRLAGRSASDCAQRPRPQFLHIPTASTSGW